MVKIKGLKRVIGKFKKRKYRTPKDRIISVSIGYAQSYALTVHEKVGGNWTTPGTQAKYLEEPLRTHKNEMAKVIAQVTQSTKSLEKGIIAGGTWLLLKSWSLVPMDTGALRLASFVATERTLDRKSESAFARSEKHRKEVLRIRGQ